MRLFPYITSRKLARLVKEIDSWRGKLDLKGPLPRSWVGRLRRDLEAEATAASVSMEGVPVTVDEVHRILAGDRPREVSSQDQELVAGYHDAMTYVLRRADDPGFSWQPELIVGLHDRVLGGRFDLGAGRYRGGPVHLVHRRTGEVIFTPPPSAEVPAATATLCEAAEEHAEHPALLAAWLHVTLAAVHPFSDGNGRVCRVLASLAMFRGGFKRREFTSLEEWWGKHLDLYYNLFACLGSQYRATADVTPFLEGHLEAQVAQVRALDLRERVERSIWQALENLLADAALPGRLANALWDVFWGRQITAGYYRSLADVSPATATTDLRSAVAGGLLASRGQRRGRRYLVGQRLPRLVAQEVKVAAEGELEQQRALIVAALGKRLM